jgi:hypothetical protein
VKSESSEVPHCVMYDLSIITFLRKERRQFLYNGSNKRVKLEVCTDLGHSNLVLKGNSNMII